MLSITYTNDKWYFEEILSSFYSEVKIHNSIPEALVQKHFSRTDSFPHRGLNLGSSPLPTHHASHLFHQALTISWHAHCQALLQPAVLASVAAGAVDQAVLLTGAGVGCIALLTPPEEALHRKGAWKHLRLQKDVLGLKDEFMYS